MTLDLNSLVLWFLFSITAYLAQFASFGADNLTTIISPVDPRVKGSYKVPEGVCQTAFDTQQQYTGWVNVPANGTYETNLFFWFSLVGFFTENGPRQIVQRGADRLGTVPREWKWDRASNMLFIDQPNQVGFSYDTPTNSSLDLVSGAYMAPQPLPLNRLPPLFLNGTFPSLNTKNTANTTHIAAFVVWHMLQGFVSVFPQYNPPGNSSLGVNLFAESYGGHYGPVFADVWKAENDKRHLDSSLVNSTLDIHLTALGINTYGLNLLTPVVASLLNASFYESGGCPDLALQCQNGIAAMDSWYDIAQYLNTRAVQDAIGSVVNFTNVNYEVYIAFASTADSLLAIYIPKLASLLVRGVRIGLMYGDRDYVCNWFGGEAVSLSIASSASSHYATGFASAGYAPIFVNDTYVGGAVRQFGNLSFSRICQAGHSVPFYQPETVFQVFARIMLGTSVSTGGQFDLATYNTSGPANALSSLSLPFSPAPTCYIRDIGNSCPEEAVSSLLNGKGVIINGVWYAKSANWPGATLTGSATASLSTSIPWTGVYAASNPPSSRRNPASGAIHIARTTAVLIGAQCRFIREAWPKMAE
ncbi:serine carboxypeptidase [Podospora didyma]|uniref:Carboxypeptidase n=1 Tax=Podospora didyma TaxID=330526 RepID=A0AAE0NH65_9PEZI|nr:serine carboxypeptidase [Podospora didyma]